MMTKTKSVQTPAAMPMERELQALIGHRLRARYAEVLAEPIPEKFLDLLERLDRPAASQPAKPVGGGAGKFQSAAHAVPAEEQRR